MPNKRRFNPLPDVRRERASIPGPSGQLHGHGAAPGSLLHQLLTQHVPVRATVRREELR